MSLPRQALHFCSAQLEQGTPHPYLQLLVEVAVVDAAVPAHADGAAAHDALSSSCIEAVHQQLHSHSHVSTTTTSSNAQDGTQYSAG